LQLLSSSIRTTVERIKEDADGGWQIETYV
jgi:hypothetical protein